jgi:hypothetical protein
MKKLFFFLVLFAISIPAFAENIYVSQDGTGDGTSCSSPRSASWFNTSGNWGSGAGQINGGDTVYLCGTINSALTMQASGSSGAAITIDGASATLSGALNAPSRSYLAIRNITWASGRNFTVMNLSSATNVALTNLNLPGSLNNSTSNTVMFDFGSASYLTLDGLVATPQGGLFWMNPASHHITLSNMNIVTTNDYQTNVERDVIRTPGAHDITIEKSKIQRRWSNTGNSTNSHNDIWQTWGMSQAGTPNSYNLTLRYNLFIVEDNSNGYSNYQSLIWEDLDGTNNIYGNVFVSQNFNTGNNAGAMMLLDQWTGSMNVFNNTFVMKAPTGPTWLWQLSQHGSATINFRNNIVYNLSRDGNVTVSGSWNHTHNNYYGNACYTSTGEVCSSNPLFLDYANNDFRIGTNSPAYNTGTNMGSTYNQGLSTSSSSFPNPTLMGRASSWDKGAYVYAGGGGKVPLAPSNLGIK